MRKEAERTAQAMLEQFEAFDLGAITHLATCPYCKGNARIVNGIQVYAICTSCGARTKAVRPKRTARSADIRNYTEEELERYRERQNREREKAVKEAARRWNRRAE